MLGWVYVKKIDLSWVFLNLYRGKMVDYFYIFSSLHDIHGQSLLQKKTELSISSASWNMLPQR